VEYDACSTLELAEEEENVFQKKNKYVYVYICIYTEICIIIEKSIIGSLYIRSSAGNAFSRQQAYRTKI